MVDRMVDWSRCGVSVETETEVEQSRAEGREGKDSIAMRTDRDLGLK